MQLAPAGLLLARRNPNLLKAGKSTLKQKRQKLQMEALPFIMELKPQSIAKYLFHIQLCNWSNLLKIRETDSFLRSNDAIIVWFTG